MNDPTEKEIDDDIHRSMAIFQRAEVGPPIPLSPIRPARVLLALDGSPEDRQVELLAARLRERCECQIGVLDGRRPEERSDAHAAELAARLACDIVECDATGGGFSRILAAVEHWNASLVLLTCPFGGGFVDLGVDSVGTDIDVLLARCPVPLLVVRAPFDEDAKVLDSVKIVFSGENLAASLAVRWSLGLLARKGHLTLSLRVSERFADQFHDVMESIDPAVPVDRESLEHALAGRYARIHSQLLASSPSAGFTYQLQVHDDREERMATLPDRTARPPLVVLGLPDRDETAWVTDTLRHCPHPVLVVMREEYFRVCRG